MSLPQQRTRGLIYIKRERMELGRFARTKWKKKERVAKEKMNG